MMLGSFFHALSTNPFLQSAILAGLLASVTSGLVGSYIVIKRIVFISGSVAHSVLSGMGICLYLRHTYQLEWLHPIYGAFVAAILSAILIGWIHLRYQQREDAVIATIWSSGMAIGVIFASLTPASNVELLNFLFGNILWVSSTDIWVLLILDIAIGCVVGIYYTRFRAICFDEEQAQLQGLPVASLYFLLLTLVALSVVVLIQIIGIILVIALLAIPATIAGFYTGRLSLMMILAMVLCAIFNFVGMAISYEFNWPPGATIALTAAVIYGLSLAFKKKLA